MTQNADSGRVIPAVCAEFVAPKDGLYGAYCDRCGFAKALHGYYCEQCSQPWWVHDSAVKCPLVGWWIIDDPLAPNGSLETP